MAIAPAPSERPARESELALDDLELDDYLTALSSLEGWKEIAARHEVESRTIGTVPSPSFSTSIAAEPGEELAVREHVDLNTWSIEPDVVTLLPESVARRHHVLAIGRRTGQPVVAMADPSDVLALDDVRSLLGADVATVIAQREQIDDYVSRLYRHHAETDEAARNAALVVSAAEAPEEVADLDVGIEDAPVVQFVNLLLRQALAARASDVHVEPRGDDLGVRLRVDGVLQQLTTAPKSIQNSVTTRLKVMAGLDISEHRVPQDGRISLNAHGRKIDLRVATLPTVHGEKVVLRILDRSRAPLELDSLGFLPEVLRRYQAAYRRPSGVILVTGPTGSGKSTTLYATLNELNSTERNLITVEDPVEYQLPGASQVQVNPRAGLTFATALRSILRADPDVLLVGEIRDRETATIAVEAALTGHLVLSCLHTNDASGAPHRLIEMGAEPFLVATAIDCVLAQRLVRVLCHHCARSYRPRLEELEEVGFEPEIFDPSFRRAVGCQACNGTGYRGRLAIQEVMLVTEEIAEAIQQRTTREAIERIAVSQGMCTLRRDGLRKAALGITSLEEIKRVAR